MMSPLERKIEEFCVRGHLEPYRDILADIFKMIETSNCNISARYDGERSVHEFYNGRDHCLIRININQFKDTAPIRTIWTILHEFGHHVSGIIDRKDRTRALVLQREEEAWEYARKYVLTFPELADKADDFEAYTKECLDSYRAKYSDSNS